MITKTIISYYNLAKQISKHFEPYNPNAIEESFVRSVNHQIMSESQDTSGQESNLEIEADNKIQETELPVQDSQFTLIGSSQSAIANLSSSKLFSESNISENQSDHNIEIGADQNESIFSYEFVGRSIDDYHNESDAETEELLCNTPVILELDYEEVSEQIYRIQRKFNASEMLYASQCVQYWEARGWIQDWEENEFCEEMLTSMELHKRILLKRVRMRLENEATDKRNRNLLYRVSSRLSLEEFIKETAERNRQALETVPPKSRFERLYNVSGAVWNTLTLITSIIKNSIFNLRYIIPDIVNGLHTATEEVLNITRGEGSTLSEHFSAMKKEIGSLSTQKITTSIFEITNQASKFILSTWWNIRIITYQKIYSFVKNATESASVSSHSTWPGSKLSLMINKFTGLLRSVASTIL